MYAMEISTGDTGMQIRRKLFFADVFMGYFS